MPPTDELELKDPRAMRALAHPARLAILDLLQVNGSGTATECAREVGGSPQAASYHLRALAKWGLVQKAASDDGRETRWELAARTIHFASGDDSPQYHTAARALGRRILERDDRVVNAYLAAHASESREWRDAATFGSASVYVTPEELHEFARRFRALIDDFERPDERDRPEGSRRVHVVVRAVPYVEPPKTRRTSP
jgi:DNA-binding transcriptional ArsR family regulator